MSSLTSKLVLFTAIVLLFMGYQVTWAARPAWELTKVECKVLDKDTFKIKNCNLTENSEGRMGFSAHLNLLKKVEKMKMKITMLRKVGKDYLPFFVEATLDICSFLQDYKRQIPWGMFFAEFSKYSNINHSCPYNHDLIIEKFMLNPEYLKIIPMPRGQYAARALLFEDKMRKIQLQVFGTRYF